MATRDCALGRGQFSADRLHLRGVRWTARLSGERGVGRATPQGWIVHRQDHRTARGAVGHGAPLASWRTTDNAGEGLARGACDALLMLDEIGQASPQSLEALAYMLGNQRGSAYAA